MNSYLLSDKTEPCKNGCILYLSFKFDALLYALMIT
jgi:hypothetical protein